MAAVGALLLTASGGYYAYAQFVKTGRADLVHQEPRPTLSDRVSSAFVDTESHPGVGQSRVLEAGPLDLTSELGVTREVPEASIASRQTKALDAPTLGGGIQAMSRSNLPGTVQALMEASHVDHAPAAEVSANASSAAEQTSMVAGPVDARVGAAIEELQNLQARRPGYVGYEPEHQAAVEQTATESPSRPASVIRRSEDRNPSTRGHMIAELKDSDYSRATPTIPEPEYATRITVPGIGLRALVEELEVVEDGDSRAWETPKHVVGHIPTTAKPGTSGQGWYFGHLESPISGEGNVFRRLPELAARFKRGEQFTIQLDAGSDRYIYQVYRTNVVHASEFAVSDSGLNDITLVSCWPQYEYSERVLVTAALVNVIEIPESERSPSTSG